MRQDSGDRRLAAGVFNDLLKRDDLWPDHVDAVREAKGLDMDFPEADERVARA